MLVLQEPGGHFEQRAVVEAGLHAQGDRMKHPVPTRPADLDGGVARDELEFLPEVVRMRVLGVVQGHEGVQGRVQEGLPHVQHVWGMQSLSSAPRMTPAREMRKGAPLTAQRSCIDSLNHLRRGRR